MGQSEQQFFEAQLADEALLEGLSFAHPDDVLTAEDEAALQVFLQPFANHDSLPLGTGLLAADGPE